MNQMKYLVVPPDWNGAAAIQRELLSYLENGWEIVSSCGAGEVVHYIIKESQPAIVKKSPGRPKKTEGEE